MVAQNEVTQEWGNNINSNTIMENENKAQSDKDDTKASNLRPWKHKQARKGKKKSTMEKENLFNSLQRRMVYFYSFKNFNTFTWHASLMSSVEFQSV